MKKAATREEWLGRMTDALRPKFKAAGYPIPKRVGLSCGWPSAGGLRSGRTVEGECWNGSASVGGRPEIFITPRLDDPVKVGAVLVHELAHAALPENVHHAGPFVKAHRALGLIDKPTTSVPGEALKRELAALVKAVGPYPHAKLNASERGRKVQGTRLLKATCPDCGYTVRVTAKWVAVGLPVCPCGAEFEAAGGQSDSE